MKFRTRRKVLNCKAGQLRDERGRCGHGSPGPGLPRRTMPQIKAADLPMLVAWLGSRSISVSHEEVQVDSLGPVQGDFKQDKVDAILDLNQPCLISADDKVLDGTHRWLSLRQNDPAELVPVLRIGLPWREALGVLHSFPSSFQANSNPEGCNQFTGPSCSITAYHGSKNVFDKFDDAHVSDGVLGKGHYFTIDKRRASGIYAHGDQGAGGKVYEVKVHLKNPATFKEAFDSAFDSDKLMKLGYDGIVDGDTLVAFKADSVKMVGQLSANSLTVNPFVSRQQQKACYAKQAGSWDCDEWSKATKGKKLPKRKKPVSNAKRAGADALRISKLRRKKLGTKKPGAGLAKVDPTQTGTLRRAFAAQLARQFALLKGAVVKLVGKDDALGLGKGGVRNVFCPTGEGGGVDPTCSPQSEVSVKASELSIESVLQAAKAKYPKAGKVVDGREVLKNIDNRGSIDSSLNNYESLGVREVRMTDFQTVRERRERGLGEVEKRAAADDEEKVEQLKEKIRTAGKISPLIVVDDGHPDGPYVLEGGHRFDALERLGAKSFPALVVLDLDEIGSRVRGGKLTSRLVSNLNPEGCNQWTGPGCGGMPGGSPAITLEQAKEIIDSVPGAKWLREKGQVIKQKLVARYGAGQALAIVASGQAIAWASAAGFAAVGAPGAWIPSAVGMIPGVVIAEMYHQLRKPHAAKMTANIKQLTEEQVKRLGAALANELTRLWNERQAANLADNAECNTPALLPIEDNRQPNDWYCGASSTWAVARALGWNPGTQDNVAKELGTTVQHSTDPQAIVRWFSGKPGAIVEAREGITVDDLSEYHRRGMYVICPVQDYMERRDESAVTDYGHYLTVIGTGFGRVFAQDSSLENWEMVGGGDVPREKAQPPNIEHPGQVMVDADEWMKVWHDVGRDGTKYRRFGIAVGRAGVTNSNPEGCNQYKSCGIKQEWTKDVAQKTVDKLSEATGEAFEIIGSVAKKGGSVHDLDVLRKGTHDYKPEEIPNSATYKALMDLGFEYMGVSLRSPTDAKVKGKKFAPGWSEMQHYTHKETDQKFEVWTHLTDEKAATNSNPEGCNQYKPCGAVDADSTRALYDRSSDTSIPYAEITGHIEELGKLKKAALLLIAERMELYGMKQKTGPEIARAVGQKILDRRNAAQRAAMIRNPPPLDNTEAEGRWRPVEVPYQHVLGSYTVLVDNAAPQSDPEKIKTFQKWLRAQFAKKLRTRAQDKLWNQYIQQGFEKGAGRAFDDVRRRERALSGADKEKLAFYHGSKQEFLRSSFGQPESIEKVKRMAGNSLDYLDGVSKSMSERMTRVLTDAMTEGKGAMATARNLAREVDIGEARAKLISRTELIRAHAEGSLDALENLGVKEVGVAVEFSNSRDSVVCPDCAALEGVVLSIDEARGIIPVHPQCRCAWTPANVGEDDEGQITSKHDIDDALEKAGVDMTVGKDRPESILGNVFCPTGEGGGVDPNCPVGAKKEGWQSIPKWQREGLEKQADQLTEDEKQTIAEYQETGLYDPMNNYLRTGRLAPTGELGQFDEALFQGGFDEPESKGWMDQQIAHMDGILDKTVLHGDLTVYRGVEAGKLGDVKAGQVLVDPGFMSTSAEKEQAQGFAEKGGAVLKIKVKHGSKALYIDSVVDLGQKELLFPRGSRLKVSAVRKEGAQKVIHATLVSNIDSVSVEWIENLIAAAEGF
jgi:SPP1 gp7 family putative phage head morphogenesis protein